MYVCICNAIKEKEVRQAAREGVTKAGGVFKRHQCKADCAQCICSMREILNDENASVQQMIVAAE